MAEIVKQQLAKAIQLADQVIKAADEASSPFQQECSELKSKTEKLAGLLRQAARASSDLYEQPTRRIINNTDQVLEKALSLVLKCRAIGLMKRVFLIIPAAAFQKMSSLLENSIGDVSWLLWVSTPAEDRGDEYLGLPPIAANEPKLGIIWEQIATLHTGSLDDRSDAAASLVMLALESDRYKKFIIEEGGVGPLLKLIKEVPEDKKECQENAATVIGLLGRDRESVEQTIHSGVIPVFAKILKEGPMKVQAVVAWAVSELAGNHPKCDLFAQHNIIRWLVGHLAFETIQEHSEYAIVSNKPTSNHAVLMASNNSSSNANNEKKENDVEEKKIHSRMQHPLGNKLPNQMHKVVTNTMAMHAAAKQQSNQGDEASQNSQESYPKSNGVSNGKQSHQIHQQSYSYSGINMKGRELEDPEIKAYMKAMAAKALWHLARGNPDICGSITESRALLCFAVLLERGPEEVQYYLVMAVMEITATAEKDAELRRSAFNPNSPACKAVVDQVLKIIEKADNVLLIPCVKAIGNLARTIPATETRIIGLLVRLLDEREAQVSIEALISLTKFACTKNYLHLDHCKAIISEGGAKRSVRLGYFGQQIVQKPALVLLSYIALYVPDSEELARDNVLGFLEWASKQSFVTQDETLEALLQESKSRLELYQS